ncbi:MAG: AI-2E family transporter [Saprospiraceae bacterium]
MFKIPFYAKAALIFIALYGFIFGLYLCQGILVPLLYALLFAMVLNPFVNFLQSKKLPKFFAIFTSIALVIVIIFGLVYFVYSQCTVFVDNYPEFRIKIDSTIHQIVHWASKYFNIKTVQINTWVQETEDQAFSDSGQMIGRTLVDLGNTLFILLLLPIYLFLILSYKELLIEFIRQLFKTTHHTAVFEILLKIKMIVQRYLKGLLIEVILMAIMNSIGLLILDIDFAIFIGITGAILNIIPYFGGIVAMALPMTIAFVTKDSVTYTFLVMAVYLLIQFIDNHFIIPYIVASRVKLNALITIVVVLVGGALWGIPGMFLSIPLTAILKVIFDQIESLQPWGYLFGNVVSTESKFRFLHRRKP